MYEVYGLRLTTLCFGLFVNILIAIFWLFKRLKIWIETLFQVRKRTNSSTRESKSFGLIENVLELTNESRFSERPSVPRQWLKCVTGIILAQTLYGCILWCLLALDSLSSTAYRCRHLRPGTDFLLNNEATLSPGLNMSFEEFYEKRKEHGRGISWEQDKLKGLLSEELNIEQKFRNISDLIAEFNEHGFHDVCNYLTEGDVGFRV